MEILSKSTSQTEELARRIAKSLKSRDVLALYGDLGSGKTTFVSYLVKALGINARVQSPTFIVLRRYSRDGNQSDEQNSIMVVNHLDLYRLQRVDEVWDIGLHELLSESDALTLIEWPELIDKTLPERTKKIKFTYVDDNTRKLDIEGLDNEKL